MHGFLLGLLYSDCQDMDIAVDFNDKRYVTHEFSVVFVPADRSQTR